MVIPEEILALMERLEENGMEAWAVGGCVRDQLLGKTPHDFDLCTNALPQETQKIFSDFGQVLAGMKHGTVAVIVQGKPVEITTFRSEGGYQDARRPDWVHFESDIRADLARRDFTVNAMAYSPRRGLCDPFGGQEDLKNHVLRAVGDPEQRFREDGLRILRGLRFAARFGLTPEPETMAAMDRLSPLLALQARERVFAELCGYLPFANVENMTTFSEILAGAIPELRPCMGFLQHTPYHAYDVYTHTAHVVERVPPDLTLRWAALLHDIGKPFSYAPDADGVGHFPGHARKGSEIADRVLTTLRAPRELQEQVVTLIRYHGITRHMGATREEKPIRRLLRRLGEEGLRRQLLLDRADDGGKGRPWQPEYFDQFEETLETILKTKPCLTVHGLAIGGKELRAMGVPPGPDMGTILNQLLQEACDGVLENDNSHLLARSKEIWAQMEKEPICIPPNK